MVVSLIGVGKVVEIIVYYGILYPDLDEKSRIYLRVIIAVKIERTCGNPFIRYIDVTTGVAG